MSKNPQVLGTSIVAKSRLFTIEAIDLRFSNGAEVTFERLQGAGSGIVMVMAVNADDELVMVKEYAAGTGRYELGIVKGRIDPGETPQQAAQRELKEEIGFGAGDLQYMRSVDSAPAYTDFVSHLFVARQLYAEKLEGDEVEPLQQVLWPLSRLDELHAHPQVNDARVLLALMLLERSLNR